MLIMALTETKILDIDVDNFLPHPSLTSVLPRVIT